MSLRNLTASFAALCAAALGTPAHAEWLEAKSAHFTIVGDVPEDVLKRRVERLERFDAIMRMVVPKSSQPNLPIMLVGSPDDVRRLRGDQTSNVLAFFSPSPFGVFAVSPTQVSSDYGINAETVLFHEYVHHMMLGSIDQVAPGWMTEGMAELFMNTRLEADGGMTIGLGNEVRGYSLNRLSRWTVERMFESGTKPTARDDVDQLYAKGWLVLHYLLFSGKREGQFAKFTDGLQRGLDQMQAAREAFGDLGKFESELEFYRRRSSLPAVKISADSLKADKSFVLRRLGPDEAELMPLRLQSMVGVTDKTAPAVLAKARPIAARYPASAFAQRALAEMEYDTKHYDEAEAAIDRALAANPDNLDALTYKGYLLGNRAHREGRADLWKTTRATVLKANRLSPNMPLPFVLFFDSFEASGTTPSKSAVDGLMRAIVLQPSYLDLRLRAGLHLISAGEVKAAREVMAPVAFAPHTSPDNPVAKLIAEIDKGTKGPELAAKIKELKVTSGNLFVPPPPPEDKKAKAKEGDKPKA